MGWSIKKPLGGGFSKTVLGKVAGVAIAPGIAIQQSDNLKRIYGAPSRWAGQGVFKLTHALTGSDRLSAAGARMADVSTRALGGDPTPFWENLNASDVGMSETAYRKGRQAGDWIGSIIGSFFVGGALAGAGSGSASGGTGASTAGSSGGAPTFTFGNSASFGQGSSLSYAGEGAFSGAAANAPAAAGPTLSYAGEGAFATSTLSSAGNAPASSPWLTALKQVGTAVATNVATQAVMGAINKPQSGGMVDLGSPGSPIILSGGGSGGGSAAEGTDFGSPYPNALTPTAKAGAVVLVVILIIGVLILRRR